MRSWGSFVVLVVVTVLCLILNEANVCNGGSTSSFVRKVEKTIDMPLDSDVFRVPSGYNAPQQVHITQGDLVGKAVIVSWVTQDEPGSNTVLYWKENDKQKSSAEGKVLTYKFYNYTSGYIHHCTIKDLVFNTKYYYALGVGNTMRQFWFRTPPEVGPDVPYTFGLIGNHEIDFVPEIGETVPFKPFTRRYHVPYKASGSTAPLWYSIKRASAYIIVLSSYSAYGKYTPQYKWLEQEFPKVNRTVTPWLIVLMHSPWYNSYNYHFMEGETMRVMYEPWFVKYKVDVVYAGHVHAYERSERVSNIAYNVVNGICTPISDQSAPVYITIGDGGNLEGLATNMTEPQPKYSAYREASFGHAMFDIKNRTHAYYSWHRNQDGYAVTADSLWFFNRFWNPVDDSTTAVS
ncbi:hypothetical protein IFM89_029126 [Coptis chinensis]|uniref:Purple acid phosphatase n=1 Tax=Coptis chinensis TaxID=261450 RepID=A0A835IQH8_9MAGN|nr:hypothetical protein IFM89_029126 [Coptis chinensis]